MTRMATVNDAQTEIDISADPHADFTSLTVPVVDRARTTSPHQSIVGHHVSDGDNEALLPCHLRPIR